MEYIDNIEDIEKMKDIVNIVNVWVCSIDGQMSSDDVVELALICYNKGGESCNKPKNDI